MQFHCTLIVSVLIITQSSTLPHPFPLFLHAACICINDLQHKEYLYIYFSNGQPQTKRNNNNILSPT